MTSIKPHQNNINFTAGLPKGISLQKFPIEQTEKIFTEKYNIQADFLTDKKSAAANLLVLRIYKELGKKYPKIFHTLPTQINSFKNKDLSQPAESAAFCILDKKEILKNKTSEMRSLFFEKNSLDIEELDLMIEHYRKNNLISSNHFLSFYLHEWLHNTHADLIYRKFGYEGKSPLGQKLYRTKNASGINEIQKIFNSRFSESDKLFLEENYGKYAAMNQFEAFSEIITQDICESLGKDLLPQKPLFSNLKFLPENISKIFSILQF